MKPAIYQNIDWDMELEEYLGQTGECTIVRFTKNKPYSTAAFKHHLYKDPRYKGRNRNWSDAYCKKDHSCCFLPVIVRPSIVNKAIIINDLSITISQDTDDDSLKKLLNVLRQL